MMFNRFQSLVHQQLFLVLIVPQMLPVWKEVHDIHLAWYYNYIGTINSEETARNTVLFYKRTDGDINYFCRSQPEELLFQSNLQREFQASSFRRRLYSKSKTFLTASRGFAVAQEDSTAWGRGVDHLVDMAAFVAHYSKTTRVGFVGLCIRPDASPDEPNAYFILAKWIMLFGVSVGACRDTTPPKAIPGCPRLSETTSKPHVTGQIVTQVCQSQTWDLKVYLVGDRLDLEMKETIDGVYQDTLGGVRQMVLGHDLQPQNIGASAMMWILASYNKPTNTVTVSEVYQFLHTDSFVGQRLGSWDRSLGLMLLREPGIGPSNFQGNTLYLGTFPHSPYYFASRELLGDHKPKPNFVPSRLVGDKQGSTGFLVELIDAVARELNFTYAILEPQEEMPVFGIGAADNYSGIVGMLHRQEVDVGLATLEISRGRRKVVDFSVGVDYFSKNLYIRANATKEALVWKTYVASFHKLTWVAVVLITLLSSLSFRIILAKEPPKRPTDYTSGAHQDLQEIEEPQLLPDTLFMHIGFLVQQGYHVTPYSNLLRFVFWLFCIASLCLFASYTATLTSSLTVKGDDLPFDTLEKAATSKGWSIGVLKGTPVLDLIKSLRTDWSDALVLNVEENPELEEESELTGIDHLRSTNFALLTDDVTMNYLINGDCSIRSINLKNFENHGYLPFRKNFPMADIIDQELARLESGGILDRMKKSWWGAQIPCTDITVFETLGFAQTVSAFAALGLGIVLSLILLVVELLVGRFYRHDNSPGDRIIEINRNMLGGKGVPAAIGLSTDSRPRTKNLPTRTNSHREWSSYSTSIDYVPSGQQLPAPSKILKSTTRMDWALCIYCQKTTQEALVGSELAFSEMANSNDLAGRFPSEGSQSRPKGIQWHLTCHQRANARRSKNPQSGWASSTEEFSMPAKMRLAAESSSEENDA